MIAERQLNMIGRETSAHRLLRQGLALLLTLLLLGPLNAWAAGSVETDWQRLQGTPTVTFLDAEGLPIAGLEELPLDAPGLSFTASQVTYGQVQREPYSSVNLHFSLVDYNFYLKDENGDVDLSLLPEAADVVAKLKLDERVLEDAEEQLSCRAQQGYLCLDVDFLAVNPFDDESRDAQLLLQYWDREGILHKGQLDYSFRALELPNVPTEEKEDQIKVDVALKLPEPEEEAVRTQTPYILIEDCAVEGSTLAGESFDLHLTYRNSHEEERVENILLQVELPEGWLLEEASNSLFLGNLGPEKSQDLSLTLQSPYRAEAGVYPLSLRFSYEYVDQGTRRLESLTHELRLPLKQRLQFWADPAQTLPSYEAGQTAQVWGSYGNWGGQPLYNVTVALEGPWPCEEPLRQLGTIKPGEGGQVSFDLLLSQEPGENQGLLRYSYESPNGQRREEERPFSLHILPKEKEGEEEPPAVNNTEIRYVPQLQAAETSSATRVWLVAAGALFVLGAAALLARSHWD